MIRYRLKELIADYEYARGRRLTMTELSESTGIYRTTLSRIAGPQKFNTTVDNLDRLCQFFGCKIDRLLEFIHEPERVDCKEAA